MSWASSVFAKPPAVGYYQTRRQMPSSVMLSHAWWDGTDWLICPGGIKTFDKDFEWWS